MNHKQYHKDFYICLLFPPIWKRSFKAMAINGQMTQYTFAQDSVFLT